MAYSFTLDLIAKHGEDASFHGSQTIPAKEEKKEERMIEWAGVLDGLGGKGAGKVLRKDKEFTEAYVASRYYKHELEKALPQYGDVLLDCADAEELSRTLETVLPRLHEKMISSMQREVDEEQIIAVSGQKELIFPSTIAMSMVTKTKDNKVQHISIWSGDSRVYVLDEDGLHQMSVDTSADQADAYTDLRQGGTSPLVERLGLDMKNTQMRYRVDTMTKPFLSICTSDGVYGLKCYTSPMNLEATLLDLLNKSEDFFVFMKKLQDSCEADAQDDCSVSLIISCHEQCMEWWHGKIDTRTANMRAQMSEYPVHKNKDDVYLQLLSAKKNAEQAEKNVVDEFLNREQFDEECVQWLGNLLENKVTAPRSSQKFNQMMMEIRRAHSAEMKEEQARIRQLQNDIVRCVKDEFTRQRMEELEYARKNYIEQFRQNMDACTAAYENYLLETAEKTASEKMEALTQLNEYMENSTRKIRVMYSIAEKKNSDLETWNLLGTVHINADGYANVDDETRASFPEDVQQMLKCYEEQLHQLLHEPSALQKVYTKHQEDIRSEIRMFILMGCPPFGANLYQAMKSRAHQEVSRCIQELKEYERQYSAAIERIWSQYRSSYEMYGG